MSIQLLVWGCDKFFIIYKNTVVTVKPKYKRHVGDNTNLAVLSFIEVVLFLEALRVCIKEATQDYIHVYCLMVF